MCNTYLDNALVHVINSIVSGHHWHTSTVKLASSEQNYNNRSNMYVLFSKDVHTYLEISHSFIGKFCLYGTFLSRLCSLLFI